MKYLLDTCVISELTKRRPNPVALRWLQERDDFELYVSTVTVGELRKGIERLPDEDARRLSLETWFDFRSNALLRGAEFQKREA